MILNFILLYYFIFFSLSFLPPSSLLHSSSLSYFTISLVFVQSLVHDCTFSFVNLCIYLSIHVNTYLHTYIHIYMYMHIFIIYIYIYIHRCGTHIHTERVIHLRLSFSDVRQPSLFFIEPLDSLAVVLSLF